MIYPLWELGLTNQEQLDPFLFGWWFFAYPSEKSWSSSVGMMKFQLIWKNTIHVPNHQPVYNHHIPIVVGLYPVFNHY